MKLVLSNENLNKIETGNCIRIWGGISLGVIGKAFSKSDLIEFIS